MQHSLSLLNYFANATITASDTHPGYPLSNLSSWIRSRQWRMQYLDQSEAWLVFDFGEKKNVNFIEIIDDASGGASELASLVLQCSDDADWDSPSSTITILTVSEDDPYTGLRTRAAFFATVNRRYYRILWTPVDGTFVKPPTASKIAIGKYDLAPATASPIYNGFSFEPIDRGASTESANGTMYAEVIPNGNAYSLTMEPAKRDAYDWWMALWNKARKHTPFILSIGEDEIARNDFTAVSFVRYVRFASPPQLSVGGFDATAGDYYWSISVELQDEL